MLELEDEQETRGVLEDLEIALEEAALQRGLPLDYVRLIAVQLFTPDELRVGLGMIN